MKIIENKIVFSNDIKKILNGNNPLQFRYFKSEVPSSVLTTIDELRSDFKQDTNNIFASNVEIITEDEMESSITRSTNSFINKLPIVTLDAIYLTPNNESIYFLDCTRLDKENNLVSRSDMNNPYSVKIQIKKLATLFKLQGETEIVIADDVIYSGSVIQKVINLFNQEGIKVKAIISAITTKSAQKNILNNLNIPILSEIILEDTVIDQICERDFYFGITGSGIATRTEDNTIKKAPYFIPFGDPITRASIPESEAISFSNNCILRSLRLWKSIQEITPNFRLIKNLPEQIMNTNPTDEITYTLKKGLR